jgi:hypothetical protein
VIKIYRNIYLRDYANFPFQKLTGRKTLLYSGIIEGNVKQRPKNYDSKKDIYITCDCDFSKWKNLKRVL